MTLTVLDPLTGKRVTITVPPSRSPERERARRWVLRELDQLADSREYG
jgi:hypothetical protein